MTESLSKKRDEMLQDHIELYMRHNQNWSRASYESGFEAAVTLLEPEIESLKAKLDKAKAALEFYANKSNWKLRAAGGHGEYTGDIFNPPEGDDGAYWENAGGKRARETLKEIE